jgi:hypothetical protein
LQELHLNWDCEAEGFTSEAFAQLNSAFSRLQTLSLTIHHLNLYGQSDAHVTLTGLAGSLKVLRLSFDRVNYSLLLGLTRCSKVSGLFGPVRLPAAYGRITQGLISILPTVQPGTVLFRCRVR